MLRYLALATALVFGALAILFALPHGGDEHRVARYTSGGGTPGPPQRDERRYAAPPVRGDAPWALSALPECFRQLARSTGTPGYVRARLPGDARPVPAGSVLHVADCKISFGVDSGDVSRGENELHVPAPVRFYVTATHLLLERTDASRAELRTFELRGRTRPVPLRTGGRT